MSIVEESLQIPAAGAVLGADVAVPGHARGVVVFAQARLGPGGEHVQKPGKGYGRVSNAQALCISCHTVEVSPKFDFQSAWAKIKH